MKCNIDARGKAFRLVIGLALLAVAAIVAGCVLAGVLPRSLGNPVSVATAVVGLFGIFESRKGWCALRAMGFKTPL
ncbi:MAG: hypothetical protein ACYTGR_07575 [Planctomycetota bacterium]